MCHSPIPTKIHNKSNLINFSCASEAVWPVGHERKSPVGKAPKVGGQIPVLANFFLLPVYILIENKIHDLMMDDNTDVKNKIVDRSARSQCLASWHFLQGLTIKGSWHFFRTVSAFFSIGN